jgi:hypothetical protein
MTDWFDELAQDRRNFLNAFRANEAEEWLRRSVVEKYAEATHFIFELIQNADDQMAKRVEFRNLSDRLEFRHWGQPFTREDVKRITALGNTAKRQEAHKIGRFGIGFKSVYNVTARPEIYCHLEGQPFAFAIEEPFVPVRLAEHAVAPHETSILLPYDGRASADLSAQVAEQLRRAGPETLMFMNHVEKLVWRGHDGTGEWFRCVRRDGVLVLERGKIVNDHCLAPTSSSYRIFSCPVTLPDRTSSMIRIAFRLDAQGKVVAEDRPMKLWVFFETEEPTGLRFRVHGPFDLTDNRANIKRHDAFNRRLINEIGDLAAKALSILRDEGRLHRPALEVVPSPSDDIPEGWQTVAERLWKHLRTEPVLPKQAGGFGTASELYLGLEDIRQSISDTDLAFLLSQPGVAWSVPAGIKNSRLERMLHHVGVKDFGVLLTQFGHY